MQYKHGPATEQHVDDRAVTGICAVFGNIDLGGDRIWPGAFAKTLQERKGDFRHLWQHSPIDPPTAVIVDIREIGRRDLPTKIQNDYPEASGGLQVTRQYLNTPRASEILEGIRAGAITGMSFCYEIVAGKASIETTQGRRVRNLYELVFFESSDVLFGMNPAAVARKSRALLTRRYHLAIARRITTLWTNR